ncbi:LacI family DNA-binding transcriptional regulator [Sphingomonas sp. AP4-R1]|uniref:LacI family DNA-binding transcriptional regulator n=1 Tax=Sphingomonas sp. AP4-R1 TaxID=2735134 RepID=UPI0014935F15|nr:LacI family DNA-binding transcriptional regulator [Sphingomonas sp. AP4-R1]QJU59228.1 LacI family DNA-binding transcriptional regulator [Sphingomonas sp. AP4-R1]
MNDRPVTSHDVARLAGVSQSAVSRAFTAGASISPDMRRKVAEAAAALGYQPNLLPRMMVQGRSGIVALVVGGGYNPHHAATLEAFGRALTAAGKRIMLVQAESDRALDAVIGELVGYRIDGVVSALSILSQEAADAISAHRIPVVTLNSGITTDYVRVVEIDNEGAGRLAAETMAKGGARRFAYVGADSVASRARQAGFASAVAQIGSGTIRCFTGNLDHDGGYAAGRALLTEPELPDALFCVNDLTAIGLIDALRIEGGCDIPGDLQVIGFDNIPAARWPAYRLTTIDQDVDDMAEEAVRLLDRPAAPITPQRTAFRLIEGGTTRHPRHS